MVLYTALSCHAERPAPLLHSAFSCPTSQSSTPALGSLQQPGLMLWSFGPGAATWRIRLQRSPTMDPVGQILLRGRLCFRSNFTGVTLDLPCYNQDLTIAPCSNRCESGSSPLTNVYILMHRLRVCYIHCLIIQGPNDTVTRA